MLGCQRCKSWWSCFVPCRGWRNDRSHRFWSQCRVHHFVSPFPFPSTNSHELGWDRLEHLCNFVARCSWIYAETHVQVLQLQHVVQKQLLHIRTAGESQRQTQHHHHTQHTTPQQGVTRKNVSVNYRVCGVCLQAYVFFVVKMVMLYGLYLWKHVHACHFVCVFLSIVVLVCMSVYVCVTLSVVLFFTFSASLISSLLSFSRICASMRRPVCVCTPTSVFQDAECPGDISKEGMVFQQYPENGQVVVQKQ